MRQSARRAWARASGLPAIPLYLSLPKGEGRKKEDINRAGIEAKNAHCRNSYVKLRPYLRMRKEKRREEGKKKEKKVKKREGRGGSGRRVYQT